MVEVVEAGGFDPNTQKYVQIPANAAEGKNLYLQLDTPTVADHYGQTVPPQYVRVVIKDNAGKKLHDDEHAAGAAKEGERITTGGIPMPKGANSALLLPGKKKGTCTYAIGWYVGD